MFKIHKLSLLAASIAMAIAGNASANLDSAVNATIFMSGASGPSNMLRENVVRNTCNTTLPINVYVDAVGNPASAVATALPLLEHTTHWVVQCTADSTTGAGLAGKTIAVYKSDAGGSGNGTTPVVDKVAVPFLDADTTNCTFVVAKAIQNAVPAANYNLYTCGGSAHIVNQIPDGGASDIEPTKFVGSLAPSSGDFADPTNKLNVKTGPGLIFGVVVTKAMRNELQADQGLTVGSETEANMPSLPRTYIRSITEGKLQLWSAKNIYDQPLTVPVTFAGADGILGNGDDVTPAGSNATLKNYVHICRRTQGSGTHAEYMIHYQRTGCMSGTFPMPGQPGLAGGKPAVFENSSSGNLGLCLDHLDKGDGYASSVPAMAAGRASYGMGYQSTEKNQSNGENWRFVKVDGYAPTRKNVFAGNYDQVYYLSFQNRKNNDYVGGPLRNLSLDAAAVNEFYNTNLNINQAVAADINQGFQFSWGGAGFVIPSASAPATFAAADPLIPWARENAAGAPDSCQPLSKK